MSVWYYIVDNYESDFFNYINSDGLSLGLQSKDDIESEINEMIESLCDLFSGFTIMGAEDLYPEEGDNPWENPETIYLQVSAEEISLEDFFWEDCFWGGFFWEDFLGGILWEELLSRN